MKRVLCVIMTKLFVGGGLTTVMLNYYRELWNRPEYAEEYKIDFLSHGNIDEKLYAELRSHGCRYFSMPARKENPLGHYRTFARIVREGQYDIVHYNCNSGADGIELAIAKKYVPVRVCHVHNSSTRHPLLHRLFVNCIRTSYTKAVAVSEESGRWLYGDASDFVVLNNAINVEKFAYDSAVRKSMRERLGLEDDVIVIGSVGRMNRGNQKNTGFLIRAFALTYERCPSARLLLVGDGELKPRWEALADALGVTDVVTFAGFQKNVEEWMQAFDVFCFPSRWEGLGMVAVEAQAAGLPVLASEAVPREVGLTPLVSFLPIGEEDELVWADAILLRAEEPLSGRDDPAIAQNLLAGGYDIRHEVEKLVEIYGIDNNGNEEIPITQIQG